MYRFNKSDLEEREGGFTLVELLVVILIIGILAAVAIPAFLNQRQRANDASVESDIKNVATQVESLLVADPNPSHISVTTNEGGTGAVLLSSIMMSTITVPNKNHVKIEVGDEVETFVLSSDVVMRGSGDASGYVLEASHSNGKEYNVDNDTWAVWDSNNGGLQDGAIQGDDSGDDNGTSVERGSDEHRAMAIAALNAFVSFSESNMPDNAVAASYRDGAVYFYDAERNNVGAVPYTPSDPLFMEADFSHNYPVQEVYYDFWNYSIGDRPGDGW